jgi:hypothetical protein
LKNVFDGGQFRDNLLHHNRDLGLAEMFRQELEEDIIYPYVINRLLIERGKRTEVKLSFDKKAVQKVLDKNKKENRHSPIPVKLRIVKVFVEDTRKIFKTYKTREIIDVIDEDFMQKGDPNNIGELCKNVLSENRLKLLYFQMTTLLEKEIFEFGENIFAGIKLNKSQKQILYQNYCRSINDLLIVLGYMTDNSSYVDSLRNTFEKERKKVDPIFIEARN